MQRCPSKVGVDVPEIRVEAGKGPNDGRQCPSGQLGYTERHRGEQARYRYISLLFFQQMMKAG